MDVQANVMAQETARQNPDEIWEDRHRKITSSMINHLRDEEGLPTFSELEVETGLSRQAIEEHMEKFTAHQLYKESIEHCRLMQGKILMKIASMALNGDLTATKLYFQVVKKMGLRPNPQLQSLYPEYEGLMASSPGEQERRKAENARQNGEGAEEQKREWQNNHHKIVNSTMALLTEHKHMPTQAEVAEATGISTQTISKHLREFTNRPGYIAEMEQFRGIAGELLKQISTRALDGDLKAAKVYFYLLTNLYPGPNSMAGLAGQFSFNMLGAFTG